ncbi:hypothetical protein A0256_23845 [Mucilaginibacter sp. PAMC 26640]|nr:hypothetical protein A0256_23845 [Mucilaginibacter sp. PAMC 26640]
MADKEITNLVVTTTLIFLLAPASVLLYIFVYNTRKKKHGEEKEFMKLTFEAELVKTQLEVQEQTLQTIGTDLHDNIGQLLSLTSLTLGSIELEGLPEEQDKINSAIELAGQSIKELRMLGRLIQGTQLVDLGLSQAISQEVRWLERSGKYSVVFTDENNQLNLKNTEKDLIVFRVVQETINNIVKHAKATQIVIELKRMDGILSLAITDNGEGFDTGKLTDTQKGMGLFNMSKRVNLSGGQLDLTSHPAKGTTVNILIPYSGQIQQI